MDDGHRAFERVAFGLFAGLGRPRGVGANGGFVDCAVDALTAHLFGGAALEKLEHLRDLKKLALVAELGKIVDGN